MRALPAETITADIHCVARWSKLDTQWRGVSLDTLLDQAGPDAGYKEPSSPTPKLDTELSPRSW
jgi:DMSO/TMAO reductase YedYZ molybdopterin-dependent catalytic subunit